MFHLVLLICVLNSTVKSVSQGGRLLHLVTQQVLKNLNKTMITFSFHKLFIIPQSIFFFLGAIYWELTNCQAESFAFMISFNPLMNFVIPRGWEL